MKFRKLVVALSIALLFGNSLAETIVQSNRELPLAHDVDVVIAGGSSAAVAAALAAKSAGASVFLIAPRTYLGDDLAGTRQLWQDFISTDQVHPLFGELFAPRVPFSYTSSVTPDNSHPDNNNQVLIDGIKYDAVHGSVQYNNNTVITMTMPSTGAVKQIDLYYYKRLSGATPFDTTIAGLQASDNGIDWVSVNIDVALEQLTFSSSDVTFRAVITPQSSLVTRYLRLACNRPTGITRQLLDEIVIQTLAGNPVVGSRFETSPLQLKRGLDLALETANIPFLTGSTVTDVLRDTNGKVAGVVMANRSGRQAVRARVVIDATEGACPALAAGAQKTPFTPGSYLFKRIVIADANDQPTASGLSVYTQPGIEFNASVTGVAAPSGMPSTINGKIYHCSFYANLATGSMLELLEIEQQARDKTWVATCLDQSDRLLWTPPDHIIGQASDTLTSWQGAAAITLAAFQPQGVDYLYLLSNRGDITRALAETLHHPSRMMLLAERIGTAAATQALQRPQLGDVSLPSTTALEPTDIEVHELLNPLPPAAASATGTLAEGARELPVLATCDVLVIGGGTAGAPAAIAAGQAGASTILLDLLYTLGGLQSDGRIGLYYHGNDRGFTAQSVDPGWQTTGAVHYSAKAEWYRQAARDANVQILFGTCANGALVEDGTVKGAVVTLPDGSRGVIRAHTVIDSTGNADIAAAAGAATAFADANEPAVQGAGWGRHILGNSYVNNDVGFVNESSVSDVNYFGRRVRASLTDQTWDVGQNPAARERRRLVGTVTVTPVDILNNRTWPDTIVQAKSNFDSHGFTVHDLFFIKDPGTASINANLPFRALLPATLDGLLVTGLGISAHRDAMPVLRMQRDVQNQGYAAGYAAAMAASDQVNVRAINIAALQQHLVSMDIIDAETAGQSDNFPLSPAALADAVAGLTSNYATLHTVLADVPATLPLLRSAYADTSVPAERLFYGHTLALLGDATGVSEVADAVNATAAWDAGWQFKGMGQYGRSVSVLDGYLIALGRTGDSRALIPVMDKANLLNINSHFSHYRSIALALENLNSGSALMQLSSLLSQIEGYALDPTDPVQPIQNFSDSFADLERTYCLRELAIARALYRIGDDSEQNGERILTLYANDPREVYASHARQILEETLVVSSADGIWINTDTAALWDKPANWQDGIRAEGSGRTATFSSTLTSPQTISLESGFKTIGSLFFTSGTRTIADGILDIAGDQAELSVAENASATLACSVIAAQPLLKSGTGNLAISGAASLGGLDIAAGTVTLHDNEPTLYLAYATDPALANTSASFTSLGLRTDFRVNQTITVTRLGVFDSHGNGLSNFKKVSIHPRGGGNPLAALGFSIADTFPLESGYRFRSIPTPLTLPPGDYSLVAFGFYDSDNYTQALKGSVGDMAGTLNDGDGAITFLPGAYYSDSGGATTFPTISMNIDSTFAVAAASFEYTTHASPKTFANELTLDSNTTLEAAALDIRLNGGLKPGSSGWGTITNPSDSTAATLTIGVPGTALNLVPANIITDTATAPIRIAKAGTGDLALQGTLGNHGGLHLGLGTTFIDSADALNNCDTLTFDTGAKLELLLGGTLNQLIYTPCQSVANVRTTRLALSEGETLTITRGFEVPRSYGYAGFVMQPHSTQLPAQGTTPPALTTFNFSGTHLGNLDLYLAGIPESGVNSARYHWTGVYGYLRKLACGAHNTSNKQCDIVFDQGCDFIAGWFDIAGESATISITNNAKVTIEQELRFVEGHASQLRLDGGTLTTPRVGVETDNSHLSLTPVIFNGTILQARKDYDKFFNLSPESAAPQIANGNAIFDTQSYNVAIRGKGFEQASDSTGALVKLGSGTLKIAAQMDYTGATLVSNGTLRLDFNLASPTVPLANLLNPNSLVVLSEGTEIEAIGALASGGAQQHHQTIKHLKAADSAAHALKVTNSTLEVNKLDGNWIKQGNGTLALSYDPTAPTTFNGALTVESGTLSIHTARQPETLTIPYASFETDPLLPSSPTGSMDKRGSAATGCPGWVFTNDNSGYQRNNSYFSASSQSHTTNGIQTAFLRKNGTFYSDLTFPATGTYTLQFSYIARSFNNWYTNHLFHVKLDTATVGSITNSAQQFTTVEVPLGYVTAGTHRLSFVGTTDLPAYGDDPCTLIDSISIQGYSSSGSVADMSSTDSTLTLNAGVTVELDYFDTLMVGDLIINGVKTSGARVNAQSHPDIFTGPGSLRSRPSGTILLLR